MNSKRTNNGSSHHTEEAKRHGGNTHTAAAAVLFAVFLAAAVVLLLESAEMLLAEWLGSELQAKALLGGLFALAALLLCLVWLRPAVARTAQRLENVYAAATAAGEALDWVREKYRMFRLLLAVVRRSW